MIVYSATKNTFILDTLSNSISNKIEELYVRETGFKVNKSEVSAWNNSMQYMKNILDDKDIPDDIGVAIEYKIPQTSKRIDFIITGRDDVRKTAMLIELKQWSEGVSASKKDAVINAAFYGGGETNHPSYQAWSYKSLLSDYNSAVQEKNIHLSPCAYLHNYSRNEGVLDDEFYEEWTTKAPLFFREDVFKLREFIKKYVKYGDAGTLIYEIENGKIRPSKSLSDSLHSMLTGNKEFTLIDNQKIVYETAISLAVNSNNQTKQVMVVKGGPGTGKSVVAINLLSELTNQGLVAQYATRNSAPREVYQVKLTGKFTKTRISNLFKSTGSYVDSSTNDLDVIIVDEAHRITEKTGLFNQGVDQIAEIINAAKTSIFFIDEAQRVHIKDYGDIASIKQWAAISKAAYYEYELESQFRCNGSDGYLAWIDNTLQIRETANTTLRGIDYDFQVVDSPYELHQKIITLNKHNNKARLLAGYCWDWISKSDGAQSDIKIGSYEATWNLTEHGQAWIAHPESVKEVGCIHTSQGLDLDYVGVIIGPDLIVREGKIITDVTKRARTDKSVHGFISLHRNDPSYAQDLADQIIKNTYRVLMTRGMKGCYIYCTDEETQEYFRKKLHFNKEI